MRRSIVSAVVVAVALLSGCKEDTQLRVTALEPNSGDAMNETYVRISGNRFIKDGARGAKVYFGSKLASAPSFKSDSEMVVVAPPSGEVGKTVDVLIIFEPGGEKRLPAAFTYEDRKKRTIDDISTSKP